MTAMTLDREVPTTIVVWVPCRPDDPPLPPKQPYSISDEKGIKTLVKRNVWMSLVQVGINTFPMTKMEAKTVATSQDGDRNIISDAKEMVTAAMVLPNVLLKARSSMHRDGLSTASKFWLTEVLSWNCWKLLNLWAASG